MASSSSTVISEFLLHHCDPPQQVLAAEASSSGRSLWTQEVDLMKLLLECPEVASDLFLNPASVIADVRAAVASLCQEAGITSEHLSVRFTHFPPAQTPLQAASPLPQGVLLHLRGTIVRMSAKRVVPFSYRMMCPRCSRSVECYTSPFDRSSSEKKCCDTPTCKREPLQMVEQEWMDYAECRLQQKCLSGELPRSIRVTLDDELGAKCSVGQFVEVIGISYLSWSHVYQGSKPIIEPTLWATNVLPMDSCLLIDQVQPLQEAFANEGEAAAQTFSPDAFFLSFAKRKLQRAAVLLQSTCPQLSGLFAPRLAMLLSVVGGAAPQAGASLRVRASIHCLLVGHPSTGKSQLLRCASQVAARSTSTTGMGSSSAGLTVAATKENGEWILEPGALVLSDGGSCIIDELRTLSVGDRASLHEAMEQQTISVAKGGLVTKLPTNCSVIAACNPPRAKAGSYSASVGVGAPLLSRFDFIFLLWDDHNPTLDERIADRILLCTDRHAKAPPLSSSDVGRYLSWVRGQYESEEGPKLSDPAANLLGSYYDLLRCRGATPALEDSFPVTVRSLESLIRVTQAVAKLNLQTICSIQDAALAVLLMERTAHSLKLVLEEGLYTSSAALDDVFLSDEDANIRRQEEVLHSVVHAVLNHATAYAAQPSAFEEEDIGMDVLTQRRSAIDILTFPARKLPTERIASELEQPAAGRPYSVNTYSQSSSRGSYTKEDVLLQATQGRVEEDPIVKSPSPPVPLPHPAAAQMESGHQKKAERRSNRKRTAADVMDSLRFRF